MHPNSWLAALGTAAAASLGLATGVAAAPAETHAVHAPAAPCGPTVDLRPKFRQGQEIKYVLNIDSSNETTSPQLPELDQKQEIRQEITLKVRAVEVGTDGSTIEIVYERLKLTIESDAITAEFDSAKSPPPTPAPNTTGPNAPNAPSQDVLAMDENEFLALALRGIVGATLTVKLDASGNISSVTGGQGLVPGGSLASLGSIGGPGGGAWIVSSPGHSGYANVGESWTTTSALSGTLLGSFTMQTRHTLRSGGPNARIDIAGGIAAGSAANTPGLGGAQVREASYSGNAVWDTQAGQLREMTTNMTATVEGNSMGVPMVMRTRTDTKVRRAR